MNVYHCNFRQVCNTKFKLSTSDEKQKFKTLIKSSLKQHIETVHQLKRAEYNKTKRDLKRFLCPHCPTKWRNNQQLDRHVETIHTRSLEERKNLKCNKCDQKFAEDMHLRAHYKSKHLNIKEYRCKLCDMKFSGGGNLKEHIGIKHLGYTNGKEWRKPENKAVREKTAKHEAYEYIQFKWKDKYMEEGFVHE